MWRLAVIVAAVVVVVAKLVRGSRIGMRGCQSGDAHELVGLGSTEISVREIHCENRWLSVWIFQTRKTRLAKGEAADKAV